MSMKNLAHGLCLP